jgi:hypothetical protein
VADNSIQIKHDIDGAKLTTENPFNGKVFLDGVMNGNVYIGIGGNVYTVSNTTHKTIQVANITPILPIPNSTIQSSPSYASFVQKYFEYSGKIYVDDWSSEIHWYTFYNPDNNMAPRDPTKHPAKTGGFDMGDWALEKRKINMSIGQIIVESTSTPTPGSSITITPPPFSIDMKKVVEGGGKGKGDDGIVNRSGAREVVVKSSNTNTSLQETPYPDHRTKAWPTAKPVDKSDKSKQLLDKKTDSKSSVPSHLPQHKPLSHSKSDKVLGLNTKNPTKLVTSRSTSNIHHDKIPPISKLRKPKKSEKSVVKVDENIAFSVQIEGTLKTETHDYYIHHTFYLSPDPTDDNTYTML